MPMAWRDGQWADALRPYERLAMRLTDGQRKAMERCLRAVDEQHLIIIKVEYGASGWAGPGVHVRRAAGWDVRVGVYHVDGDYQFGGEISMYKDRAGAIGRAQALARWFVEQGVDKARVKIRAGSRF